MRALTKEEEFILSHAQDIYGSYNQAKRVDFDETGKASISAVDRKHTPVILIGTFLPFGTISTFESKSTLGLLTQRSSANMH